MCWMSNTPRPELERRLHRAEAEVEALRVMVRSLVAIIDPVPEKTMHEIHVVQHAITLAGSPR